MAMKERETIIPGHVWSRRSDNMCFLVMAVAEGWVMLRHAADRPFVVSVAEALQEFELKEERAAAPALLRSAMAAHFRIAGAVVTERKSVSSALNGTAGGRPRKVGRAVKVGSTWGMIALKDGQWSISLWRAKTPHSLPRLRAEEPTPFVSRAAAEAWLEAKGWNELPSSK